MTLGDYSHLGPYVTIIGGPSSCVKIGEFVAIGAGTKIICSSDDASGPGLFGSGAIPVEYRNQKINEPVIIERFASIAVNVIIMPGVKIAEGSAVAPNSFVHKDTKPWTIYYGNPLRAIRTRDIGDRYEYAKKLGY
jgi:acetyltransferase-like isoleucine patch superfamily enzyme